MTKPSKITVSETEITITQLHNEDYICITDIARYKNPIEPKDVVKNWMRNRSTIEFLGLWEKIHNPNFKGIEFDPFLFEAGSNKFSRLFVSVRKHRIVTSELAHWGTNHPLLGFRRKRT